MAPPLPQRRQPHGAVDRSEADEAVDDPGGGVGLAEVEAEDPRNQVELGDGDEAPVQPADDHRAPLRVGRSAPSCPSFV